MAKHRSWRPLWCGVVLAALQTTGGAAEPLRYGVFDSMGYPFNTMDAQRRIRGGLLTEWGSQLARELGTELRVIPLARRRVDPALLRGDVDLVCYYSPQWTEQRDALSWSVQTLPQIERLVVARDRPMPTSIPQDLQGKRVATQLGYSYAPLQPLFDRAEAVRLDDSKVASLFKSVEIGAADVLVTSEGEIEGYFHDRPDEREHFEVSSAVFTRVATQCAVSPQSRVSLQAIDRALTRMMQRGDLARLAKRYGLSAR